ncbi:MAG: FRG domain-containing protein [Planctomycetota bacterium]|jgi:hypothetical protein
MEKYGKLTNQDFCEFSDKTYEKGVLALRLTSWDEFKDITKKFDEKTDYIWRGHSCHCEGGRLRSSFDRKFPEFSNDNRRDNKLKEIFYKFKQRLEELPDTKSNRLDDDEIWAIGQHYGLPTPLLDWTECPYIAAYFAFFAFSKIKTYYQTEYRVVYALNRALKRDKQVKKNNRTKDVRSKERFVKFLDLEQTHDETQNTRLEKQKGKFTKALNGIDIEANVETFSKRHKTDIIDNQKIILAQILIPNKVRDECMAFLKSKKITHGTLFPDYAGAVEICKMELGID